MSTTQCYFLSRQLPDHGVQAWLDARDTAAGSDPAGYTGRGLAQVWSLVVGNSDAQIPIGWVGYVLRHRDGQTGQNAGGPPVYPYVAPSAGWSEFSGGGYTDTTGTPQLFGLDFLWCAGDPSAGLFIDPSATLPDGVRVRDAVTTGEIGVVIAIAYCEAAFNVGFPWEMFFTRFQNNTGTFGAPGADATWHLTFSSLPVDSACPGAGGDGGGGGTLPQGAETNPFNFEDIPGLPYYHATNGRGSAVIYSRSKYVSPAGGWDVNTVTVATAAAGKAVSDLRVIRDRRQTLLGTFCQANPDGSSPDTYKTFSNDDGATWEDPTMAISGGKHPTVAIGQDSVFQTIVIAAVTTGAITAQVMHAGDTSFGTAFTFKDDAGADIAVQDDTFHIQQAPEGASRWILHCLEAGGTSTSHFESFDDCHTWVRIT